MPAATAAAEPVESWAPITCDQVCVGGGSADTASGTVCSSATRGYQSDRHASGCDGPAGASGAAATSACACACWRVHGGAATGRTGQASQGPRRPGATTTSDGCEKRAECRVAPIDPI